MSEEGARKGLWDRTYQVGVAVRDLDQAIEFYERLGIGPFVEGPSAHSVMRKVYGEDAPDTRVAGKIAQMGNIEFELLSPIAGRSVQGDFIAENLKRDPDARVLTWLRLIRDEKRIDFLIEVDLTEDRQVYAS